MGTLRKIFRKPESVSGWTIYFGFIIYLFVGSLLDFFDPFKVSHRMALAGWYVRSVSESALAVAIVTMIITGIRNVKINGYSLKRLLVPCVAIIIGIFYLIVNFGRYTICTEEFSSGKSQELRKEIEPYINSPNISINKKSEISKLYAKILFDENGVQSLYITEKGNPELYKPTNKEIVQRKRSLETKEFMNWGKTFSYLSIYFWMLVIGISSILGFIIPIPRDSKRPPNQGMQTDAGCRPRG